MTAAASILRRTPLSGWIEALGAKRRVALNDAWQAFWTSRLVVLVVGVLAVLKLGVEPSIVPPPVSRPFGGLGNLLISPATSYDAVAYIVIAKGGYGVEPTLPAFFPLYPLLMRVGGWVTGSVIVAGILISTVSFLAALYLLHRLTALELGERYARPAVFLMAFFPMAFFFSAVYTEGLFLALSIGAIYAGRQGRWLWAGVLGGLAAATRNTGVLLLVPLLLMYAYGPRADRKEPDRTRSWWRPSHPIRADLLLLALVPAGLACYLGFMAIQYDDFQAPLHAVEAGWARELKGPLAGAWEGLVAAWDGVKHLWDAGNRGPAIPGEAQDRFKVTEHSFTEFAFLVFAVIGIAGVFRRLPAAYGAYALLALLVPLSSFNSDEPLMSLPRYVAGIFPLYMWLAALAVDRKRLQPVLVCSAVLLGLFTAEFSTWRFVA